MSQFLTSLLSSAGVSALLATAIVWLGRTYISENLKASIKHEYEQKLAVHNAEIKASIDREAEKIRFAASSFGEVQKAVIDRKLAGVDALWEGVLRLRHNVPPVVMIMDVMTEDEYGDAANYPDFKKLAGGLSAEKISELFTDSKGPVERERPYVGEYLWALFATYQNMVTRVILMLHLGVDDAEKLNWHQDSVILGLLRSSLSAGELQAFEHTKFGKFTWLQRTFELRILAAMERVISGKQFSEEALKQAEKMEAQVRLAEREQPIQ